MTEDTKRAIQDIIGVATGFTEESLSEINLDALDYILTLLTEAENVMDLPNSQLGATSNL